MRARAATLMIWCCVGLAGIARAEEDLASLDARIAELYEQGDYAAAMEVAEQAVNLAERKFGRDALETTTSLDNLAGLCKAQGRYDRAEALLKRALSICEKVLGTDHPDTAVSLNNLAGLYGVQAHYSRAEPLLKRALTIHEKALAPDHPDTARSLDNLADLYSLLGQYAEAEPLYERALAIKEKALDPEHPDTATTLDNLAGLYVAQGQHALAEPLYKRAMTIREKALGEDHPDMAASLNSLAGLYLDQGRYAHAEPLLRRAIAILEKAIGMDHPDTATSLDNLAVLHYYEGRYAKAEQLFEQVLAINEKSAGEDHPHTAESLISLASVKATLGKFSDAAVLTDRARRGTRRHVACVLPSLSPAEQAAFLRARDEGHFHAALTLGLLQKSAPQIASLSAGWLANGKSLAQEGTQQGIAARQADNHADNEAAAAVGRQEPWVEIDAIRRNIPAGAVLVDIARFDIFDFKANRKDQTWRSPCYVAWIVPPAGEGDVIILDLGPAREIDAAVAAYREAIKAAEGEAFEPGRDVADDVVAITAAPLTQKLLQPIVEAIGPATEIILSPDGPLWLVPWQAIPLADGTFPVETFAIRTVTSGRDLVPRSDSAEPRSGSSRGPVVVTDPARDASRGQ